MGLRNLHGGSEASLEREKQAAAFAHVLPVPASVVRLDEQTYSYTANQDFRDVWPLKPDRKSVELIWKPVALRLLRSTRIDRKENVQHNRHRARGVMVASRVEPSWRGIRKTYFELEFASYSERKP